MNESWQRRLADDGFAVLRALFALSRAFLSFPRPPDDGFAVLPAVLAALGRRSNKSRERMLQRWRVLHFEFAAIEELPDGYAWHDCVPLT